MESLFMQIADVAERVYLLFQYYGLKIDGDLLFYVCLNAVIILGVVGILTLISSVKQIIKRR